MLATHLPALVIVIPLVCAPLCVLLRRKDWAFMVALLATWASFACSIMLTAQVMQSGTISYAMGGWAPPYGIEIRIDVLGRNRIHPPVTCDGQVNMTARPGDSVLIRKKPDRLTLLHPLGHSFYASCRDKLRWSNALVN